MLGVAAVYCRLAMSGFDQLGEAHRGFNKIKYLLKKVLTALKNDK